MRHELVVRRPVGHQVEEDARKCCARYQCEDIDTIEQKTDYQSSALLADECDKIAIGTAWEDSGNPGRREVFELPFCRSDVFILVNMFCLVI